MVRSFVGTVCCLAVAFVATTGRGDDVRFYEENGQTIKESRTLARVPVRDVRYEDRQQTVYRQQETNGTQSVTQYYYYPVTQYRWEPRWHGWWRIFQGPHLAYHYVPTTQWQVGSHSVQLPGGQRQWVPETRTVKVAIPQLRFEEREQVTRTVVASDAAPAPAANGRAPAYRPLATPPAVWSPYGMYGGTARLDGDPPRYATGTEGGWQARR
jgi:hypothetical protein